MGRTVVIGDVHGCAIELSLLLERLALTGEDQVYFVGDLVARGPASRRVLQLIREVRGISVRGNHEQRLIDARGAVLEGLSAPRLEGSHRELLESFSPEDWELVENMPLTLDLPEQGLRLVHGGVVPGWPLSQHSARLLTRLRTIRKDGSPSERLDGRLWGETYCGPPHVVFGHNAITGLQLHPSATGLDSGCVYGSALTALVLPKGTPVPPPRERRELLLSVPAREAYQRVGQ